MLIFCRRWGNSLFPIPFLPIFRMTFIWQTSTIPAYSEHVRSAVLRGATVVSVIITNVHSFPLGGLRKYSIDLTDFMAYEKFSILGRLNRLAIGVT
jgi:hypothetical protein